MSRRFRRCHFDASAGCSRALQRPPLAIDTVFVEKLRTLQTFADLPDTGVVAAMETLPDVPDRLVEVLEYIHSHATALQRMNLFLQLGNLIRGHFLQKVEPLFNRRLVSN